MLATVMNGSRQSWKESADGLTETVGAPSLREKRRVGRRWWTMRRSDGTRRRRPPRSVSPRAMGGVLRSTREEGARLRVPPRGRGAGDDQWCSPPSSRASPLPSLGESARACAAHAASPPSAPAPGGGGRSRRGRPAGRDPALAPVRAALSGCRRRRTVRHPVPPRFAPPGRHGPGAEAGGATLVGACRGPAAAVRAGPDPSSRPRVTAVPAIAVRTPTAPGRASEREPHRNRHHARRRTPAPPNPRDRRVTHEIVT